MTRGISNKNTTSAGTSQSMSDLTMISEDMINKISGKLFEKIDQRLSKMEETINGFMKQINDNSYKLEELEKRIDSNEQYSRLNNLRIYGVKDLKNENTEDEVISIITNKLGIELPRTSIERCHRIGSFAAQKSRPILVRFAAFRVRCEVYKNKKMLKKSGVVIREDLTKSRLETLKKAVDKLGPKNVWTLNGNIHIIYENQKKIVKCIDDLPK